MGLFDSAMGVLGLGGTPPTSQQSSTSSSYLYGGQQPYLQNLFSGAQNLYSNPSPYTGQAQQLRADRAIGGSPLNPAAQEGLLSTIQGDYLPGGSRYQDISDSIMRSTMAPIDSRFASGGRFGSGLHKQGLGQSISDQLILNSNLERQNQLQAIGMAPQLANQDYYDINQLSQAGQVPWQELFNFQQGIGAPITLQGSQSQGRGGLFDALSGMASFSF